MAGQMPAPSFRRRKVDQSSLIPRPLKRSKNAPVPAKDEQPRPWLQQQRFQKPPLPPTPSAACRRRWPSDPHVSPLHRVSEQKGNPSLETAPRKGCDSSLQGRPDSSLQKGPDPSGRPTLNIWEGNPTGQDNPKVEMPRQHHMVACASQINGSGPMEESKPMEVDKKEEGRKIKNFSFVNGEGEMDYPFQRRPSGFEGKEEEEVLIPPNILVHGVTSNGQEFKKMDIWKFKYADGIVNMWVKARLHDWWELGEPSDSYKDFLVETSDWTLSTDIAIGADTSSKLTLRISISKNDGTKGVNFNSCLSIGDRKKEVKPRQVIFEDDD